MRQLHATRPRHGVCGRRRPRSQGMPYQEGTRVLKSVLRAGGPALAFLVAAFVAHQGFAAAGKIFCLTQLTMSLYYAVVVVGLALVVGYAGQVSLGHAGFFALGGYTTAILTTRNLVAFKSAGWAQALAGARILVEGTDLYGAATLTVQPWVAFVAAVIGTGIAGALIGYPALRLRGHYLAMGTLGFGVIVNKMLIGTEFAGAADGIVGVPAWHLPGGIVISGDSAVRVQNYYTACVVVVIVMILLRNLVASRIGRALLAIHDRETAANAMGINTARYKLQAFVMSAMLAAAAGVFLTHYTGGIGPSEAGALKSVRYLALVAVGGMTNLWGVLFISTAINYLSLRGYFGTYDNAVFGTLLILIISLAPNGPLEPLGRWVRRLVGSTGSPAPRET